MSSKLPVEQFAVESFSLADVGRHQFHVDERITHEVHLRFFAEIAGLTPLTTGASLGSARARELKILRALIRRRS
jgi:hypothetical protein